jgi:hypothetical protein
MDEEQYVQITKDAMELALIARDGKVLGADRAKAREIGERLGAAGGYTFMLMAYRIVGAMWAYGFCGDPQDPNGFSPRCLDMAWHDIHGWQG